jgi:hypothetical protein
LCMLDFRSVQCFVRNWSKSNSHYNKKKFAKKALLCHFPNFELNFLEGIFYERVWANYLKMIISANFFGGCFKHWSAPNNVFETNIPFLKIITLAKIMIIIDKNDQFFFLPLLNLSVYLVLFHNSLNLPKQVLCCWGVILVCFIGTGTLKSILPSDMVV